MDPFVVTLNRNIFWTWKKIEGPAANIWFSTAVANCKL